MSFSSLHHQITDSFELLNYSEFGTEVNGQLFSCDLTEHPLTPAAPFKPAAVRNPADDPKAFYANIRDIVDKRRGIQREETQKRLGATARYAGFILTHRHSDNDCARFSFDVHTAWKRPGCQHATAAVERR